MRISAAALPLAMALGLAGCGTAHRGHASRADRSATHASPTTAHRSPAVMPPVQALVTAETENRLLVVDLPSGRVARQVTLPPDPEDIAATGNGGLVTVVSSKAGKVTVLDRRTLRPLKIFAGFDAPHIVAISPGGQYAYITDDPRGQVAVIGLHTDKLLARVFVGAGAHHLSFSPDGRQVWVALGESASQIAILTTVVSTPPPPASPVVDPGQPRAIGRLAPGFLAHDLSFTPNGREVWITSASGTDVGVFGARDRRQLFRVPVGPPPQHIVFSGHYAYLTSGYGGILEKVDATSGRVTTRTSAPYGSFELDAADGYVVTTSLLRGTLAIYTPDLKLLRVVKLAPATREVAVSRA
jgi:DNA-binding beta-propeller fold protein YncE